MGHIGLTPQSSGQLGGFKAQGRTAEAAAELIAESIQESGAFALLMEAVPPEVCGIITDTLSIPVYSIGAGIDADGANFRIEIAGVERATTMAAMIKEADRRDIVIHRAIAAVGGSTYCDFAELKDMAQMAKDARIEVIMTVGHRKGWDTGAKEITTSEGRMQGFRLRGSDNISFHIADIMRNIEAGFRGFLVYDEGVLFLLNKMREQGLIPEETIFKFSVFGGVPVRIAAREQNRFKIDPAEVENAITPKTKAFILNTPSNPTGAIFDRDILEQVAAICQKYGIIVISDEPYEHILFDNNEHVSIGSLDGMQDLTVSIYTLSKSYAMTG